MEKIKTATGRVFDCDYFNPCDPVNRLTIRVLNASITDVAAAFSTPSETAALWCGGAYASQYTKLVSIMPEDNAIRVTLRRA